MRLALVLLAVLTVAALAIVLWIRLAPSDPARWHVDPLTTPDPATPNFARVDRIVALPPETLAESIARRARDEGAVLLAGDAIHATWIARSRLMRYPDYVSLRLIPEGEGTRVVAFSRARFGRGDLGVNAARLARWLPSD